MMSWDVVFLNVADTPPPMEQMPDDWVPDPLGSADEVRAKISRVLPSVDWSDPTTGIYESEGYSFEFNINDDPVESLLVFVRGKGDAVADLIKLGESCRWYILDGSQGEWLHQLPDPYESWEGFQALGDQSEAE